MKYLALIITCLFMGTVYVGEANGDEPKAPSRKVIKPPTTARPQSSQERRVATPPNTARPQLPQGFGRPYRDLKALESKSGKNRNNHNSNKSDLATTTDMEA